jgi:DMSO/TMAO reductase YedYZ molybdopterin-dependent catalytic subunit
MRALPPVTVTVDIHCVTRRSKLGTQWRGVSVDTLLGQVNASAPYVLAFCDGGYTTNLPTGDITGGKAWVAFGYDGGPLEPEHGGPARLLVPHLYFWKSAKWVRGLELRDHDAPGFWETYGYPRTPTTIPIRSSTTTRSTCCVAWTTRRKSAVGRRSPTTPMTTRPSTDSYSPPDASSTAATNMASPTNRLR